jgi:hypothetical protein
MLTSIHKMLIIGLCAASLFSISANAQPANKAKERIAELKKIKLLDILNLDETSSEKFLISYSQFEKKIEAKKSELDESSKELRHAIRDNLSKEDIKKLSSKYIEIQTQFFDLLRTRLQAMSTLLSETDYAKYLVFENEFPKELQKILFEHRMKDKGFKGRR